MTSEGIPITVVGGYLGAGKTTLLNRLLAAPHGRRLGVIVNDFGSIGIDAELLADAAPDGIVNLPNGCVCCTLGEDLYEALRALRDAVDPPDHIVIEASGVADPAVAAAWGTSAGFTPGGVIVLAAADTVRRQASDKYVGGEVRRQLAGADLVVVTKGDLCQTEALQRVDALLAGLAPRTLRTFRSDDVDATLVFDIRPDDVAHVFHPAVNHAYDTWAWTGGEVSLAGLEPIIRTLPDEAVRLKGTVALDDGRRVVVQTVGPDVAIEPATPSESADDRGSRLVAIFRRPGNLDDLGARLDAVQSDVVQADDIESDVAQADAAVTGERLRTRRHR